MVTNTADQTVFCLLILHLMLNNHTTFNIGSVHCFTNHIHIGNTHFLSARQPMVLIHLCILWKSTYTPSMSIGQPVAICLQRQTSKHICPPVSAVTAIKNMNTLRLQVINALSAGLQLYWFIHSTDRIEQSACILITDWQFSHLSSSFSRLFTHNNYFIINLSDYNLLD